MASQVFILGVILMSVQLIYSQEEPLEIPKAPHEDFKREWYPETQEWVIENYEKDSVQKNKKLVAFTNRLETNFIDKLRNETGFGNLTFEVFSEMHKNGSLDSEMMSKVHSVGLAFQQAYVKKIIELYGLEPGFLNTTAQTFCDIFEACQFLTTLPPTITTTMIPTTIPTTVPTTVSTTTTTTTTSTNNGTIESTQSVNEISEEAEIEAETVKPNVTDSGTENFINDRAVLQKKSDENFDQNNLENDEAENIATTLEPVMTEANIVSSTTPKTEITTSENVVTDKPEVVPIENVGDVTTNDDEEEHVEDANPEHDEHADAAASSQSEGSGASYVHLNIMVFAIVIGACFL